MKLAAYVCAVCGAELDTDDPRWTRLLGDDVHLVLAPPAIPADDGICGRAVLKRSAVRQEQVADDAAAVATQSAAIHTEARRAVRRRDLGV